MAQLLFSNFNTTTLAGAITNTSLSLAVAAGSGALYPSPGANQYFTAVLADAQTKLVREVIQVTGRQGDTFTIVRGQQGSTASAYNAGDIVICGITAGDMAQFLQTGVAPPENFGQATLTVAGNGNNSYALTWNLVQTTYGQGNPQGLVQFLSPNTSSTVTLSDGTKTMPLVKLGGSPPAIGDATGYIPLFDDGQNWRFAIPVASDVPQIATNNPTLYYRSDGSDSNNGSANTAAAAFLTPQAAVNYTAQRIALGGRTMQIIAGIPGTYPAPVSVPAVAGAINFTTATNAPSSYILQGGATTGYNGMINVLAGANVAFLGMTFSNTSTNVHNLFAATGGIATVSNCTFTTNQSSFSAFAMYSQQGGNIQLLNAIGITMAGAGVLGTDGGYISMPTGATITLNGTYTYTDATVHCSGGQIELYGMWSGATPNATRYRIDSNGAIKTNGQGANYIPGSSAGTVTTNPYS